MSKPIYVLEYDFEVWGNKGGNHPYEKISCDGNTREFSNMKQAISSFLSIENVYRETMDTYIKSERDDFSWTFYERDGDIPDLACAKVKLSLSTDGGVVPMAIYEASAFRRD